MTTAQRTRGTLIFSDFGAPSTTGIPVHFFKSEVENFWVLSCLERTSRLKHPEFAALLSAEICMLNNKTSTELFHKLNQSVPPSAFLPNTNEELSGDPPIPLPNPNEDMSGNPPSPLLNPNEDMSGDPPSPLLNPNEDMSGDPPSPLPNPNEDMSGDPPSPLLNPNEDMSGDPPSPLLNPNENMSGNPPSPLPNPNEDMSGDPPSPLPNPNEDMSGDPPSPLLNPNGDMSGDPSSPLTAPNEEPMSIVPTSALPYPDEEAVVLEFPQTRWPRSWFLKVVTFKYYNILSGLVAFLNCVALTLYVPCGDRNHLLKCLDAAFCIFFVLEMMMYLIAHGPKSHLTSRWNQMDVAILFAEMMGFFFNVLHLKMFITVVDFLRPLRLIQRISGVRKMLKVLSETMQRFLMVTLLIFICHVVFSLPVLHLFKDSMHNRCYLGPGAENTIKDYNMTMNPFYDDPNVTRPFMCSLNKKAGQHCTAIPSSVKNNTLCSMPLFNSSQVCVNFNLLYNECRSDAPTPFKDGISYDNIGRAMITMFQVFMLEGWSDVMYLAMDSRSYYWSLVFFVFFSFIGGFIMMYLWAVVVTTEFSKSLEKEEHERRREIIRQKRKRALEQRLKEHKPIFRCSVICGRLSPIWRVWHGIRRLIQTFVHCDLFATFINLAVWFSIFSMVAEHHKQSENMTYSLHRLNVIVNIVFLVEMTLLIIANPFYYFTHKTTVLDFFITTSSSIEMVLTGDGLLALLRALRLLRLVRLVNSQPYLKKQVSIMIKTLEQSIALILIMLLFVFDFSLLGMHLFGCTLDDGVLDDALSRKNFKSIFSSMLTVFQTLTLEDWNYVLFNTMAASSPWCALYFVTLIVLGNALLFNILVSIVVHNFQSQAHSLLHYHQHQVKASKNGPETTAKHCCLRLLQWFTDHHDYSLYVFAPENKFRRVCQRITSSAIFGRAILFLIFLSCIQMAMENPKISTKSIERIILTYFDFIFTCLFLIEMALKVISQGLFVSKSSYGRDPWNFLDGVLVILSTVDMIVTLADSDHNNSEKSLLGILKVMRLLRTLRPFRAIKYFSSLKLAISTILASLKPIANVLLVSGLVFTVYAICGVHLFKGAFYNCMDDEFHDVRLPGIMDEATCLKRNYRWVNRRFNFDNFLNALLTLFVMYSKDGWVMVMYDGIDAVGEDIQPIKNYRPWWSLYFITFIAFSIFLMDMLLGTILDKFREMRQEVEAQRALFQQGAPKRRIGTTRPLPPTCLMRFIPTLDKFMIFVIVVNITILAAEHHNQPEILNKIINLSFYVFTGIYILQVIVKFVAFGYRRFFANGGFILEFVLTFISVLHIILKYSNANIYLDLIVPFRLLLIANAFKNKILKVLMRTVFKTSKEILHLCLLILFFFFIYAVLTVELFGHLECTEDYPCVGLNQYVNFHSFSNALLALYQVSTCDNWSSILADAMRECRPNDDHCLDFNSWAAPICLGSFVMVVLAILGNMIIATLMKELEDSNNEIFGPPSADNLVSVIVSRPPSEPDNDPDHHSEGPDHHSEAPDHHYEAPDHHSEAPDHHSEAPSPDHHSEAPAPDHHSEAPAPDHHYELDYDSDSD